MRRALRAFRTIVPFYAFRPWQLFRCSPRLCMEWGSGALSPMMLRTTFSRMLPHEPISAHGTRCLWDSHFYCWFCGGHSCLARPERTADGRGFRPRLPILLPRGLCGTSTVVGTFYTRHACLWTLPTTLRPQQWRNCECDQSGWSAECGTLPLFCRLLQSNRCFCRAKLAKTFGHLS